MQAAFVSNGKTTKQKQQLTVDGRNPAPVDR